MKKTMKGMGWDRSELKAYIDKDKKTMNNEESMRVSRYLVWLR